MAERVNSWVDSMCNSFLGSTLIKTYSIQIPLRCHCGQRSLCEAEANLESPDTMIVTEVGIFIDEPVVLWGVGLQVLTLQRLHVILIDFKCRAELYRQPRQHVVTRHQEQGLAIDFLSDGEINIWHPSLFLTTWQEFWAGRAPQPDPGKPWLAPRTLLL